MNDFGSLQFLSVDGSSLVIPVSAFVCIVLVLLYALVITILYVKKIVGGKNHDRLTGMLNLQGFETSVERLFRLAKNHRFLLSELNVRDFAFVNRIYGADKGDLILKCIAKHLTEIKNHSPNAIIARGYADNFYILQPIEGDEKDFITAMEMTQSNLQEQVGKEEDVHIILKSGNIVCINHGRESIDIRDMISKVGYARRLTQDSVIENFSIYDSNMRIQHENEERIENGIEKAMLLPVATKPSQQATINNWAASVMGGGLYCCGTVHPDAEDALDEVERIKALGLCGVKFHSEYQQFCPHEERMFRIYEKIAQLGLLAVFHGGWDPY